MDEYPYAAYDGTGGRAGGRRPPPPTPSELLPRWQHDQFDGPRTAGSSVFVRNLPPEALSADRLMALFSPAGQVAFVQVDSGPLPTATIGFVRKDAAGEAERRFHGRWLQGSQLKVSVVQNSSLHVNGGDEDFWRRELREMPRRGTQPLPDRGFTNGASGGGGRPNVKGRGQVAFVPHDRGRVSSFDRRG